VQRLEAEDRTGGVVSSATLRSNRGGELAMHRLMVVVGAVLLCGAVVSSLGAAGQSSATGGKAQNQAAGKIDAQWHCPADPTSHKLDVGDEPEHSYSISQGSCSISSKAGALPEKSATTTEFDEAWKNSYKFQGRANVTLENGDKVFYAYEGFAKDASKPPVESWKIAGGTGKYKEIKGSGSCAGQTNPDNTSDWHCTGTYSLGK
jgi:hypothetical protein